MIYTSAGYLWYGIKVSIFVPQNLPKGEKANIVLSWGKDMSF